MESTLKREQLLFDAALEIQSPVERSTFLERECAGNEKLRQRVERLLALHARAEEFFDECQPALHATERRNEAVESTQVASDTSDKPGKEIGTRIGHYKLLQKIGEGGCGVVYMAEQQQPVRRRVALKIIKVGMDTRSVIARFEAERQALAMMDHPNIARVLDAGETETGRPFFVMELVNGIRITTYCDERKLDTRERLNLFIQVCHAIQHAHQKGIIHRDIKPSNILVTHHDGVPVPKVIDFGIAKATQEPLTDKTLFTIYGHFIGTPAYMSPEQAEMSGLDVDTRSDIYSLGVLLYELLTGKTPFDQKELLASGIDEMRKTLREREPHRPSTKLDTLPMTELTTTALHRHAEPPKLRSLLSGDLDWIAMKALEKDRKRRYETANGLAMDVQRYLNNEPILARPPSRIYRFQKLVRRNRGVFVAASAVALTLLIGLSTATWLFVKEREMRHRAVAAEKAAERARANEAELRQQAEMREKIARARFLISQGKLDEADAVATGIVFQEPTLDGAAVLRAVGDWHSLNGRWAAAAQRFWQALQVNQLDGAETISQDFSRTAVALVKAGAADRFEPFREHLIARVAGEKGGLLAQSALRAYLLLPATKSDLEPLQSLARDLVPNGPAGIGSSQATADRSIVSRLKLENIGTGQPCSLESRDGVLTMIGGGGNIYENADEFAYAFTLIQGDFDYRMRVHSVTPMLDSFTRVGLMVRESLNSIGSRHVTVAVNANATFQVIVRSAENAFSESLPQNPLPATYGSNSWVRLQRVGAIFHAYTSSNGVDWAELYAAAGRHKPFSEMVYFGIAASAHSTNEVATNIVSDFSTTPTVSLETALTLTLFELRRGNAAQSAEWCERLLVYPECNAAQLSTARIVQVLARQAMGDSEKARAQLAQAREMLDKKSLSTLDAGNKAEGNWFEWAFAGILLQEAARQ